MVGDGTFLHIVGQICDIPLHIQSHLITFLAYILPISNADIILGASWLATLGPHIADYQTSTIKFYVGDHFITLQGDQVTYPTYAQFHHLKHLSHTHTIVELFML